MDKHREILGRKFKIVKNGLDAAEVASFIETLRGPDFDIDKRLERLDSLIATLTEQYDLLTGRLGSADSDIRLSEETGADVYHEKLEHLDSLTRLAQRTIIEADKEAESIRSESDADARSSADRIIAEAEEKAQGIVEQARSQAEEDALAVKQEIEQMLARSKQALESEIRGMFAQASRQLSAEVSGAESSSSGSMSDPHTTPDPSESEDVAYGQADLPEEGHEQPFRCQYEEHPLIYADPYEDTVELEVESTVLDPQ